MTPLVPSGYTIIMEGDGGTAHLTRVVSLPQTLHLPGHTPVFLNTLIEGDGGTAHLSRGMSLPQTPYLPGHTPVFLNTLFRSR